MSKKIIKWSVFIAFFLLGAYLLSSYKEMRITHAANSLGFSVDSIKLQGGSGGAFQSLLDKSEASDDVVYKLIVKDKTGTMRCLWVKNRGYFLFWDRNTIYEEKEGRFIIVE